MQNEIFSKFSANICNNLTQLSKSFILSINIKKNKKMPKNLIKKKVDEIEKITEKISNSDCVQLQKDLEKIKLMLQGELEQQTNELKNILLERKSVEK